MESIEEIDLLFKSGNDVPVTRATITLEQWEAVKANMEMTEERAREILNQDGDLILFDNGGFEDEHETMIFDTDHGPYIKLDSFFTAEELMAIAWWMRNKGGEDAL